MIHICVGKITPSTAVGSVEPDSACILWNHREEIQFVKAHILFMDVGRHVLHPQLRSVNGATVTEEPKWEVGQCKTFFSQTCWIYWCFFLFTENLIDSTHVSIRLNFCFSCLFSLKHLTWTVLPCIHPKFVTREVFSHSSSEGGEILGPSSLQNYLQLWAEGCVTESCAIRFMNVSKETCRNLRDQNVCVKQMDWPAFISVMEIGRHTSTAF